jgi:methionine synthase I (cobalamin-dependent)
MTEGMKRMTSNAETLFRERKRILITDGGYGTSIQK